MPLLVKIVLIIGVILIVFAPANCPREDAQRARSLAKQSTDLGIPNAEGLFQLRYAVEVLASSLVLNTATLR